MKILCYTILLITTISTDSFAQTAHDYMSKLGVEYKKIQNDTWDYVKATAHSKSARKIEKRRGELVKTVREVIYNIKKLGTFQGDNSLREAAVNYLTLNEIILNEDYAKIVDLEEISEDSYDAMEAYLTAKKLAREKLSNAGEQLSVAEKQFAGKHGINLVEGEDKQGEKLKMASEAMDYYNEFYLIFFKSYKQEYYTLTDLNNKDVGAFEQNKNTLQQFSANGIDEAETRGSYKGDPMIKIMTRNILNFFKYESSEAFNQFTNYLLLEEKMGKMSKYIESIKPAKRTKEDVDNYNKLYSEYKASYDSYVKEYENLGKKRAAFFDQWNDISNKFISKYVPK